MGWPPGLDRCAHCSQYVDECRCRERAREQRRLERREQRERNPPPLSKPQRRVLRHAANSMRAISGRYIRTCESLAQRGLITYHVMTMCRTCEREFSGYIFKCGHRNRGSTRIYAEVTREGKLAL